MPATVPAQYCNRRRSSSPARSLRWFFSLSMLVGCGGSGDATRPLDAGSTVTLTTILPAIDTMREGRYEAWLVDVSGVRRSLARFAAGGTLSVPITSASAAAVEITLEPPGDVDGVPSSQLLLTGALQNRQATLGYAGAITQGQLALRTAPGQFTMFSPSDNDVNGYPSHEESGVWLFNMSPATTEQRDYYVRMTQLQSGWTYEGWMVRDMGLPSAIWLSYGKFVPDWTGALNAADDTGWGPFSGVLDFSRARTEDFPGDDWISNPLALSWPSDLPLPLDLRQKDAQGKLRWTHVITIEPSRDKGEPVTSERPFFIRPYIDSFGDLPPGVARTITFHGETLPSGTAVIR